MPQRCPSDVWQPPSRRLLHQSVRRTLALGSCLAASGSAVSHHAIYIIEPKLFAFRAKKIRLPEVSKTIDQGCIPLFRNVQNFERI